MVEVGDRVTFINGVKRLVKNANDVNCLKECDTVLKIERPKWEVVEEKKELLTEEEREYLKQYLIYSSNQFQKEYLIKRNKSIWLEDKNGNGICFQYNKEEFEGLGSNKKYTLKELRIGELNGRRNKDNRRIKKIFK